jgi:hypothetical protein
MASKHTLKMRRISQKKKATAGASAPRKAAIAPPVGLSIKNDRLVGPGVSFIETPNKGGDLSPRYLVFHYTAGKSAAGSISWLGMAQLLNSRRST